MIRLSVKAEFSSAHFLREYQGKCENMHGHNWTVIVEVGGERPGPDGLLMDFGIMKKGLARVIDGLDHKVLNDDVEYFRTVNPTAENIARYIFDQLKPVLINDYGRLTAVTVSETERSFCRYEG
jgi:6-pyruvoyltetrahydropterin/6-carboxytetrahydropterin synthase